MLSCLDASTLADSASHCSVASMILMPTSGLKIQSPLEGASLAGLQLLKIKCFDDGVQTLVWMLLLDFCSMDWLMHF